MPCYLLQVLSNRLGDADSAAQQAVAAAKEARRKLDEYMGGAMVMETPPKLSANNSIAASSIRKTLQVVLIRMTNLLKHVTCISSCIGNSFTDRQK